MANRVGISNRETPDEEASERRKLPTQREGEAVPQDAAGNKGDAGEALRADQTSHKAGSRSIAQKESRSRYPDRSTPSSHKVGGASGREPEEPPEE
jgi:hypothetical protein